MAYVGLAEPLTVTIHQIFLEGEREGQIPKTLCLRPKQNSEKSEKPCFQAAAFSLILVDLFGWKDSNVHSLTAEILLHVSVVGIWFSLNRDDAQCCREILRH